MNDDFYEGLEPDESPQDELARMAQETIESQMGTGQNIEARQRCQRVLHLHNRGAILDSRDYFHASLILLYGERASHFELSRSFAHQSATMGEPRAWTLYAMSWDRLLLAVGKPQRFGTQIIKKDGRWSLGPIDESVSDQDRAFYAVPPLFFQKQRARQLQNQEERD